MTELKKYGDVKRFRGYCEALDEYEMYANTIQGGAEQEKKIDAICAGYVLNPKLAKTAAVIKAKKEKATAEELETLKSIAEQDEAIRSNSILKTLSDDIKTILAENGYEGKNVSFRTIEKLYIKRDGTLGKTSVTSKEFPEACKGLLDPLNPIIGLPTSVWLATIKPNKVSTGEFVIELRFSSCYYDQYKEKYSNCNWLVKFTPSDRPVIVNKKSNSFSDAMNIFDDFTDDEEDLIVLE